MIISRGISHGKPILDVGDKLVNVGGDYFILRKTGVVEKCLMNGQRETCIAFQTQAYTVKEFHKVVEVPYLKESSEASIMAGTVIGLFYLIVFHKFFFGMFNIHNWLTQYQINKIKKFFSR